MAILKNIRIMVAVLCVLLLALGAAGCGKNESPPASTDGKNQAQQADSDKVVNLDDLLAKGKAIEGMYFENEFTVEGNNEKMNTKTWIKGTKVRSEMAGLDGMGEVVTLVDSDKSEAYMYMPAQNMATRMDLSGVQQGSQDPRESFDEGDMKYLGREVLEGQKCAVYEILASDKKVVGKLWLWEKHGLPLRMESEEDGQKVIMVYKNYEFKDLEDALFELPAGVQVMDMQIPQS